MDQLADIPPLPPQELDNGNNQPMEPHITDFQIDPSVAHQPKVNPQAAPDQASHLTQNSLSSFANTAPSRDSNYFKYFTVSVLAIISLLTLVVISQLTTLTHFVNHPTDNLNTTDNTSDQEHNRSSRQSILLFNEVKALMASMDKKIVPLDSLRLAKIELQLRNMQSQLANNSAVLAQRNHTITQLSTADSKPIAPAPGHPQINDTPPTKPQKPSKSFINKLPLPKTTTQKTPLPKATTQKRPQPIYYTYKWRPNDSLWRIAKKYWGVGAFYPVILELNPSLNIQVNPPNTPLKILKDRNQVKKIYDRIVIKKNGKRFMRYRVLTEDNWKSISLRFYGTINRQQTIKRRHYPLIPNKRIAVALKE